MNVKFVLGFFGLVFFGSLTGCVSTSPVVHQTEIIDHPPIGVNSRAAIGDSIVRKAKRSTFDALVLHHTVEIGNAVLTRKVIVHPATLVAAFQDDEWTYYESTGLVQFNAGLGARPTRGGLAVSKIDPDDIRVFESLNPARKVTPKDRPDIEHGKYAATNAPNFEQELIYNGRVDNNVKFLYREFRGGLARDAFTQEVQYDLNEGRLIAFKEAQIEIVNATNTALDYKVLRTFADRE